MGRHALLVAACAIWLVAGHAAGAAELKVSEGQSIQAAVDRAQPGDVIRVAGRHRETVTLTSGLTLKGEAGSELAPKAGDAIVIRGAKGVTVEDLAITLAAVKSGRAPTGPDGIWIDDAQVDVRHCRIRSGHRGIFVTGKSTAALEQNTVTGAWYGITYADAARGEAADNRCTGMRHHGISVSDQAAPTLRHNTLQENRQMGLIYFDAARGEAVDNRCIDNGLSGIQVGHNAAPSLRRNRLQGNRQIGISFFDAAHGEATDNRCSGNGLSGIQVADSAAPSLRHNTLQGNTQAGIRYSERAGGEAINNLCLANGLSGIIVTNAAAPTLRRNTLMDNRQDGLTYFRKARGEATDNLCVRNRLNGIAIETRTARPVLNRNLLSGNLGGDRKGFKTASNTIKPAGELAVTAEGMLKNHGQPPRFGWSGPADD